MGLPDNNRRTRFPALWLAVLASIVQGAAAGEESGAEPLPEEFLLFLEEWAAEDGRFVAPEEFDFRPPGETGALESGQREAPGGDSGSNPGGELGGDVGDEIGSETGGDGSGNGHGVGHGKISHVDGIEAGGDNARQGRGTDND